MKNNFENIDIDKLLMDQGLFCDFVFTPVSEAVEELSNRWKDENLGEIVYQFLGNDIPLPLATGFKAVIFRQVFTPNYEFRHFEEILKKIKLEPMYLEYLNDKFASQNSVKYFLGKMRFYKDVELKNPRSRNQTIIDFNSADGKIIKEVKTLWNQPLVDFHHELLNSYYPEAKKYLSDTSEWFSRAGGSAKYYYPRYLGLFIRNGILFENFVFQGGELKFIKEVFLPAFIEVWKSLKRKPLIVPLLPLETQEDIFWMAHPHETLNLLDHKII